MFWQINGTPGFAPTLVVLGLLLAVCGVMTFSGEGELPAVFLGDGVSGPETAKIFVKQLLLGGVALFYVTAAVAVIASFAFHVLMAVARKKTYTLRNLLDAFVYSLAAPLMLIEALIMRLGLADEGYFSARNAVSHILIDREFEHTGAGDRNAVQDFDYYFALAFVYLVLISAAAQFYTLASSL